MNAAWREAWKAYQSPRCLGDEDLERHVFEMPEGFGGNSALDFSAQALAGRSVRPLAHISRGAAEGSGVLFCLHRIT